jgi:hypothetical protein
MSDMTPSVLVERIITARDAAKRHGDRQLLDVMADAANYITEERKALLDIASLAEDERQRGDRIMELLTQAREYVSDALDAYRHDDGIELLRKIDAETSGIHD